MKPLTHFGPGSELPAWMESLDRRCFGEAWGGLSGHEETWAVANEAFVIWALNPAAAEAELLRIAVEPELRRRGLGRELLRSCEAPLKALGIGTLLLEVRVSNGSARALYAAQGWHQDGLRKGYYRDGEDAALYRKEL